MIGVKSTTSDKTSKALQRMIDKGIFSSLDSYGRIGVDALSRATPLDTGLTASSWGYSIVNNGSSYGITWFNTNVSNGFPVAIMLQYGHGTGTGGYVAGEDYINPAIQPIFDQIALDVWKKVTA